MRHHGDHHSDPDSDDEPVRADTARGDPIRPVTPLGVSGRVGEWVEWFGIARLVTSALAVVVVCTGTWFLLRTPTPPPESSLPVAVGGTSPPTVTLTAPSTMADRLDERSGVAVVHVAGSVMSPGVYELPADSRVADALERAGGPAADADPSTVNLAALVVDGSRIYVPAIGEEPPPAVAGDQTATGVAGPVGPIDVNTADATTLETLPGVGPATAAAIVAERERHGPFTSVEDLERVAGIGPAKVAALAELVVT